MPSVIHHRQFLGIQGLASRAMGHFPGDLRVLRKALRIRAELRIGVNYGYPAPNSNIERTSRTAKIKQMNGCVLYYIAIR